MNAVKSILFILLLLNWQALAASEKLPLPRFASLRSNKVNIHVGPGADFPVEWMFQRQGLPIEIIAEFDTWRQIRDMEGTTGWVHKSLLVGKRNAIVINEKKPLKKSAKVDASVVVYLEPGVVTKIKQCKEEWCRLEIKGHDGWIERKHIWGIYPHEEKF